MEAAQEFPHDLPDHALLVERRPGHAGPTFARFYQRHERAVLAYFRRRVASPELAADLAAETFAQALASRGRFRTPPGADGSAVAWLFGIAGHVLARSARRGRVEETARRHLGIAPTSADDDQLRAIDELGTEAGAQAALALLPPEQRDAVWARIVLERDYQSIAADLQCSEAVVRKRVSRGITTLRRHLKEPT